MMMMMMNDVCVQERCGERGPPQVVLAASVQWLAVVVFRRWWWQTSSMCDQTTQAQVSQSVASPCRNGDIDHCSLIDYFIDWLIDWWLIDCTALEPVPSELDVSRVGFMFLWVGLGWIDENGPMSNSVQYRRYASIYYIALCRCVSISGHPSAPLQTWS